MAHKNVEVIEKALKAFLAGDFETVLGMFGDDFVLHVPGKSPLAGDYKGKEEFAQNFFGRIMQLTDNTARLERHDVVGGDEHVVGIYTWTASRNGKTLSWRHANIYHVRDGKIAEVFFNPFEQDEFDELFS